MSNEDLLAGLPAAPAKKRGRLAKSSIEIIGQTGVTVESSPLVLTSTTEEPSGDNTAAPEQETGETEPSGENPAAPEPFTAEQEAKFAASLASLDEKQNSLAPVSTDYTLAMANRVTIVGGKREYAYQRIIRQGKRL